MTSRAIICAIAASALTISSLSFARDNGYREHPRQAQGDDRRDDRRDDHRDARQDWRSPHDQRAYSQRPATVYYYNARGPEFRRGGRIPQAYRGPTYVVEHWREHRLAPPPRGQHWVQIGPDYVLVAIATGVITQLLLGR